MANQYTSMKLIEIKNKQTQKQTERETRAEAKDHVAKKLAYVNQLHKRTELGVRSALN